LHLLSAISPEWVAAGKEISVKRAPTNFGEVNFVMKFVSANRATLTLDNHFTVRPADIVVHLPWFMNATNIVADGKAIRVGGDHVELPAGTREVEITWAKKTNAPAMSFDKSVAGYKAEYRRRYEIFLRDGVAAAH
jgi:hypothetical protein